MLMFRTIVTTVTLLYDAFVFLHSTTQHTTFILDSKRGLTQAQQARIQRTKVYFILHFSVAC